MGHSIIYKSDSLLREVIKLSTRSKELLMYFIFSNSNDNHDFIIIPKDYMVAHGIKSVNTYKAAVKELIEYEFIYPTKAKNVFRLNSISGIFNVLGKKPNIEKLKMDCSKEKTIEELQLDLDYFEHKSKLVREKLKSLTTI